MKSTNVFQMVALETEEYESKYGVRPNTVILGVKIYDFMRSRIDVFLGHKPLEFAPKQLMGMDITIDYDRKYVIGVSYVHDYSDLFNENNILGD